MAPTKKKKKPAGNPARGFATTSVPAKSSIVTGENVDDAVRTTHIESTSTTTTGNLKADVTVEQESDKQIHTLTPEDLEAHLEESSLQLLIDNFAAKSKKDASRLASKLKAEQRILRTQSEQLSVNQWLSDELVEFALNLLKCEKSSWNNDMDMDGRKSIAAVTEDDLILKLWTLELVLSELGFKTDDIQNAFQSILQKRPLTFPLGKDLIWGLEESLDYLALTCQSANLPDYDCYRIQSSQKAKKGSSYTGPKVNGRLPPYQSYSISCKQCGHGARAKKLLKAAQPYGAL